MKIKQTRDNAKAIFKNYLTHFFLPEAWKSTQPLNLSNRFFFGRDFFLCSNKSWHNVFINVWWIWQNASDACDKTSVKMTVMNAIGVLLGRLNVECENNVFIWKLSSINSRWFLFFFFTTIYHNYYDLNAIVLISVMKANISGCVWTHAVTLRHHCKKKKKWKKRSRWETDR